MQKRTNTTLIDKCIGSYFRLVCNKFYDGTSRKLSINLLSMALIAIILSVYLQVGSHDFLNYDDNVYVYDNPHVVTGITRSNILWAFASVAANTANWHPITWLSHMADAQLYGMNPGGHHLTNVFIHAISTVLLFLLLFRLTSTLWQSLFVAALFALHPLHVESVAWVAERKDVLSAFFGFLSLLLYAEYVVTRKTTRYLLSLFSFVLGLMSKPMLVTLPVVMLLLDFWPLRRDSLKAQKPNQSKLSLIMMLLKEKIPFFTSSLFSAVITVYAQHKGGAINSLVEAPFGLRIGNGIVAYIKYIAKTLWPHDLAVLYPLPSSISLWQVICSLFILLFVSAATIWSWRRYPYLAVGWFWFLVTLVPVIGIIQVGSQSMADRYTYIPIIGLFIMAAWGVPVLTKNLPFRQGILVLLAGIVISASAVLTWQQLHYWQDSFSLFRHTLKVTSGNYTVHNNLGIALASKGDLDAAIKEYRDALAINPNYFDAHNNLGIALAQKGELDAAINEYRNALAIKPNYFKVNYNLGIALAQKGDLDAAIKEFRETLTKKPDLAEAHNNMGFALAQKGDLDAAIREYREALAINPRFAMAQSNLEAALEQKLTHRHVKK